MIGDELTHIYEQFVKEKHKIPADMAFKLQTMHDYIGDPECISKLTEEEQETAKDFIQLGPKAVQLLFISIVRSILSPKMYCSFEKNCKIKMEGYLSRWTRAYITFDDRQSVTFNTIKKKLKFKINHLELQIVQAQNDGLNSTNVLSQMSSIGSFNRSTLNAPSNVSMTIKSSMKPKSTKVEFRYKGLRKLKIKFEHQEAAQTLIASISQMQSELKCSPEDEGLLQMNALTSEWIYQDYKQHFRSRQINFRIHKKQPKLHIQIFMQNHFWNALGLVEFMITQQVWNTKVKEEKIIFEDGGFFLIHRKYKSPSFLVNDRRYYTRLKIEKFSQNVYRVEEEFQPTPANVKTSTTIGEMAIHMMIQILAPKLAKISFQVSLNGKGFCRQSDNRSMLVNYFSDIVFLNTKYAKLKEKGKLKQNMNLKQIMIEKGSPQTPCKYPQPKIQQPEEEEVYYTISNNEKRCDDKFKNLNSIDGINDQEFFDVTGWEDQQSEDDGSDSTNKENSNHEEPKFHKKQSQGVHNAYEEVQEPVNHPQGLERKFSVDQPIKLFNSLKPKSFQSKLKPEYLKLLRETIYERSYLKQYFSEDKLQKFREDVPWYDPSVLIPAGKEYRPSENKEMIFINDDLIQSQKDSLRFVMKQIGANLISGKSVMNVSLPVDIFQSKSLLERSAASFACAPKYLKPVADADPVTQMKAITGFLLSVSTMELIMQKPFNPILGETLQVYVGGIPLYYEQISHHPPISSYFMKCDEFTLFGNLNAVANVSLNSGSGGNAGMMTVVMRNGNEFLLSFPLAEISGLIYGTRKYSILGKCFAIQKQHRLFTEVSLAKQSKGLYQKKKEEKLTKGDLMGGIFRVSEKFLKSLQTQKSLLYYGGVKKTDMEEKIADIRGVWYDQIFINGQQINNGMTAYPLEYFEHVLPSDANFRLDVMMHRIGDLARSQTEKQVLENIQRRDRKLRDKLGQKK